MSGRSRLLLALALGAASLTVAGSAHAKSFKTLYRFTGGADGDWPSGDLVLRNNALYGTTSGIAVKGGYGTVFKLDLVTGSLTTLYSFGGGTDGAYPSGGVIFDAAGTLYGTTGAGGRANRGTVFKLDPITGKLATLHAFTGADGADPQAGLVFSGGTLYGTTGVTGSGSTLSYGTVFALDPATRKLTTLHSFTGGSDGWTPLGPVVFDAAGMLYGVTAVSGGSTIYELDPATHALATLYNFKENAQGYAQTGLVLKNGNLYGATIYGRFYGGSVFRFNLPTQRFRTLYFFTGGADGSNPFGDLLADPAAGSGLLYGTTSGFPNESGTVFRLRSGPHALTTLHAFSGRDGAFPRGGMVMDATGTLYGTTEQGGISTGVCRINQFTLGCGTIFKLVP